MFSALRIECEDWLRYHPRVRSNLAAWTLSRVKIPAADDPQAMARTINKLSEAARLAVKQEALLSIEQKILEQVKRLGGRNIDWRQFHSSADRKILENALVLKPYVSEREKGVIYLSFEYQWMRLLQNCDVREFARRYHLVLAPVWAVPYSLVNYLLPAMWPGTVFSHLSDPLDAEIIPRMAPNYVTVPLLCSNWVNPEWYQPVPFERKDIDIFMLANFGKYKRHFALFKALRDLPRDTRVLLIGQHHGSRTREVLMSEARAYGVEGRFELKENATDAEVFNGFARSKTNLILSRREGSCIAVVESLFANTPSALLEGAEVGSRMFINEQTGRFLKEERLAADLTEFIAQADRYQPLRWAMENKIHCHGSSAILNDVVKKTLLAQGQDWTQDLAPFHWRPWPQVIHEADRPRTAMGREDIQTRFGIQIGKEAPCKTA